MWHTGLKSWGRQIEPWGWSLMQYVGGHFFCHFIPQTQSNEQWHTYTGRASIKAISWLLYIYIVKRTWYNCIHMFLLMIVCSIINLSNFKLKKKTIWEVCWWNNCSFTWYWLLLALCLEYTVVIIHNHRTITDICWNMYDTTLNMPIKWVKINTMMSV